MPEEEDKPESAAELYAIEAIGAELAFEEAASEASPIAAPPRESLISELPVIAMLDTRDPRFLQYLADVRTARGYIVSQSLRGEGDESLRAELMETLGNQLTIYAYIAKNGEDLLSLAARCNIPYSTLATLNRLDSMTALKPGARVFLPSVPGLFIPEEPLSDLEQLLYSAREDQGIPVSIRQGDTTRQFRFMPAEEFLPTERTFFLNPGFRFPLNNYRVTSNFGYRVSPITGRQRFHDGLDLAAPTGTEVYAVRDGEVIEVGENAVLGRYVMIRHGDNWVSIYGHLSRIDTVLRNQVRSGTLIGRVGSTGLSTGPHLHFELRQFGVAQDPSRYFTY